MAWCNAPGVRLLHSGLPRRSNPTGTVRSRAIAAGLLALSLGACDFPTDPPIFESRFVVPGENTTLSVNQLLPSSVSVSGNAFTLALSPQTVSQALPTMCPTCTPGMMVPLPGFTSTVTTTVNLPSDVASAALTSGTVNVLLQHNFGFDPINPPGAATKGKVVTTITNNGRTVGYDSLGTALPSGTPTTRTITLAAGTIQGPITVTVVVTSPPGGAAPANWVQIPAGSPSLTVTATPTGLTIASANVTVASRNVSVTSVNLDLSDIDETLSDRASSGAIVLKMVNPWAVTGTLQLRIQGNGVNITKNVTVAAGTTTQRITFTESEIRQMLGQNLTLTITGPISAASAITVTPNQVITVETTLDLVLSLGA